MRFEYIWAAVLLTDNTSEVVEQKCKAEDGACMPETWDRPHLVQEFGAG